MASVDSDRSKAANAREIPAKWASEAPPQGRLVGVVDEYGTVWAGEPGESRRIGDLVVRDDEETSWLYIEVDA